MPKSWKLLLGLIFLFALPVRAGDHSSPEEGLSHRETSNRSRHPLAITHGSLSYKVRESGDDWIQVTNEKTGETWPVHFSSTMERTYNSIKKLVLHDGKLFLLIQATGYNRIYTLEENRLKKLELFPSPAQVVSTRSGFYVLSKKSLYRLRDQPFVRHDGVPLLFDRYAVPPLEAILPSTKQDRAWARHYPSGKIEDLDSLVEGKLHSPADEK